MPMLEWNDGLSIGIPEVDTQHQGLVGMVNKLHDSMKEDAATEVLLEIVEDMREYTVVHFGTEEDYMRRYEYPEYDFHKSEHEDFVAKVVQLERDYKSGKVALSMEVLNFLSDWLVTHIVDTDKEMGVFLVKQGAS